MLHLCCTIISSSLCLLLFTDEDMNSHNPPLQQDTVKFYFWFYFLFEGPLVAEITYCSLKLDRCSWLIQFIEQWRPNINEIKRKKIHAYGVCSLSDLIRQLKLISQLSYPVQDHGPVAAKTFIRLYSLCTETHGKETQTVLFFNNEE